MLHIHKRNWNDLKGKYIWLEYKNKIPIINNFFGNNYKLAVFVKDVLDNKLIVIEKRIGEKSYNITEKGYIKETPISSQYKFSAYLTEWEILDFEVTNYLSDISKIEYDDKTIQEFKYMQKCADFEIETYNINKKIAQYFFASLIGINFVTNTQSAWIVSWLPLWFSLIVIKVLVVLLFIVPLLIYIQHYYIPRSLYKELILKLQEKIL